MRGGGIHGKLLDVSNNSMADGGNVIQWTDKGEALLEQRTCGTGNSFQWSR
jgi:hypothetical protein